MKQNNWVLPALPEHVVSLNDLIEGEETEGRQEGEQKPSQKQAISTQIDERKGPATHTSKKGKGRKKGRYTP